MAIIGDGKGGIFCEDSLEVPKNWKDKTQQSIELSKFDVLLTNPPFGKDIKVVEKASWLNMIWLVNGKKKEMCIRKLLRKILRCALKYYLSKEVCNY